MAFSVRVSATSVDSGQELFCLEPRWWAANDLRDDPRFEVSETAGYADYDADLSPEEFRELHERFKPEAVTGLFGDEAWKEIIPPQLQQIEDAIELATRSPTQFHVTVFEWESGLDW